MDDFLYRRYCEKEISREKSDGTAQAASMNTDVGCSVFIERLTFNSKHNCHFLQSNLRYQMVKSAQDIR